MMTLANYGIKSNKHKDPVSAKALNKSLQIRNRAETLLKNCLKTFYRLPKDKRNDIIGTIEEYYSRVPLSVVVWNTNQTKQCVTESILASSHDFNPYKARVAYQTIEEMLINLEYLPWHKEFTKIVTYSGGFRHTVGEALIGPEEVFRAAGFEQESRDRPMHLVIHPKRNSQAEFSELIAGVVFDCMLAQVIMSDIISVFESCCKTSKISPNRVLTEDINHYSWIQEYFQERSAHITERSCSNIQELLNNVTNHLTKVRMTSVKTNPKNDRLVDEHTLNKVSESSTQKKSELCDNQQRKPLSSRLGGDPDLFRLSDDLLKLPNYSEHEDSNQIVSHELPSYDDLRPNSRSDIIQHGGETNSRDINAPHHHSHPARLLARSRESLDMIDANSDISRREFSAPILKPDLPINDRELLIPKQERKTKIYNQNELQRRGANQSYTSNRQPHLIPVHISPVSSDDHYRHNSIIGLSKINLGDQSRFKNFSPSHPTQSASKNASSRYDADLAHDRYEYRDTDKPFSSRGMVAHWSCNSCTFINHMSNEICEMCRSRKVL